MIGFLGKVKPALWLGNGFGWSSATYELRRGGVVMGHLEQLAGHRRWRFVSRDGREKRDFPTFAAAKADLTADR